MKIIETIPIYTTTNVPGWSWPGLLIGILFLVVDIFVIYGCGIILSFKNTGILLKIILVFLTCISFILSYLATSDCFKNAKEIETFSHSEYIIQANEDTTLGELNKYEILEYIDNYTFRVKENNNAE